MTTRKRGDPRFHLPPGALFQRPPWALRDSIPGPRRAKSEKRPPAAARPHRCAILGIDAGRKSGVAFGVPELWSFRTEQGQEVTRDVRILWTEAVTKPRPELFTRASEHARSLGLPLLVCGEKWGSGNRQNDPLATKSMMGGLNASWGKFDLCREMAGIVAGRVERFFPYEWQPAIVGSHLSGMEYEERKRETQLFVKRHYNLDVTTDESDAVCIMLFGMRDERVRQRIPVRKIG